MSDEPVSERDWAEWHAGYDDPGSLLSERLEIVQRYFTSALDAAPAGEVRVVSMCAGQGRDVIGVLRDHPRRSDVRARLVELDERNVDVARRSVRESTLVDVEVVLGDAGESSSYEGLVPAGVVLVCGVFGNVTDEAIERTICLLPSLCDRGATVIWTRHRMPPDLTPVVRRWFVEAGFAEVEFAGSDDLYPAAVGMNRFSGQPAPFRPDVSLFAFDAAASARRFPPDPGQDPAGKE